MLEDDTKELMVDSQAKEGQSLSGREGPRGRRFPEATLGTREAGREA